MENQQRAPKQAISQQKIQQQRAQQQRMRRKKNNIVKILLLIILAIQLICMIELMVLIRVIAANKESSVAAGRVVENSAVAGMTGKDTQEKMTYDTNVGKIESEDEQKKDAEDWELVLVNKWNEMEEGYEPELTELTDGHRIDARIADDLMDMIQGAKKAGHSIYILSAYRDMEKQTSLYEAEVAEWRALGYSPAGAKEKAGTVVAVPGTSEHQLGLAVDLVSSEYVQLDEGAEKTQGYKWLVKHCHEYGFILRYPNGKTDITGIIYEPWHFRYVGKEAAEIIMKEGLTLEEYLEQLN